MGLDNKAYTYYRILRQISEFNENHPSEAEIKDLMKKYSSPFNKPFRKGIILKGQKYLDRKTIERTIEINMNGKTITMDADKLANYNKTPGEEMAKYNPFEEFKNKYKPSESLEDRLKNLENELIDYNLELKKINSASRRYPELKNKIENDRVEYLALTKVKRMNNYNQQI